ncbi:hypothetical protein I4U23_017144 [Adineta vaga]|uniref:TPR repeat containing protein-like protein n=1 Tax=Adineta vaga TaxID=104782 RepID=B3G4D9_ADIVA|nr:TPR repeat containing protein-like protein [Adineta vaga]UJR12969.1 hypothetical protein I4U23_017144 [Adineta vaga]
MMESLFGEKRIHSKKGDYKDADYLRVIGAGLPRTGTSSLKAALELLGFGPCHHMMNIFDDPSRGIQFIRALDGYPVDFHELMKGYGSTVDNPAAEFYKEIHQVYPNSKIILTVRDSGEKWFESVENTIVPTGNDIFYLIAVYPIRFLRLQCLLGRRIHQRWITRYGSYGPQIHDLHNARVISENKKDDLLIFNVKEGWPPLCKFLDVPIPTEIPFPNINDTKLVQRVVRKARVGGLIVWAFIFIIIAILIRIFL